jgi:ankyrin repeat protein
MNNIEKLLVLAEENVKGFCSWLKSNKELVDLEGDDQSTLLIILSSSNNLKAVDCLLRAGADKDKRNDTGETALHSCINGIKEGDSSIEMLDFLLRSGCNAEIHGYLGLTPLHQAVIFGLSDCVSLLLNYGANPYAIEKDALYGNKRTAFDIAKSTKSISMIDLLEKYRLR